MKKLFSLCWIFVVFAFSFTGCSSPSYFEKHFEANEAVHEIVVSAIDRQISFCSYDGETVKIDYFENDTEFYEISENNGILKMTMKTDKQPGDYVGLSAPKEKRVINVYLPKRSLLKIEAATTNEDIIFDFEYGVENCILTDNNGNILLEKVNVLKSLELTTKNGGISGEIADGIENYNIKIDLKKGHSNISERTGGFKNLGLSVNNGDINLKFN